MNDLSPHAGGDGHGHDMTPGVADIAEFSPREALYEYALGLGLAVLLTVTSFVVAGTHLLYEPGIPIGLVVLAIAQMGVHLVFFLHITTSPDNTNNVLALAFGMLIVLLVVGGTVFIMTHLNDRMMPMDQMMQMQR